MLANAFVDDNIGEKEFINARDQSRARVLRMLRGDDLDYNSIESYGGSNDNVGPSQSDAPRPYIPPTPQTADGYVGLDPPLG